MTNKELEKKIEELSAQIEALKGELKETPKGEIWKPKKTEYYWYIEHNDRIVRDIYCSAIEENGDIDNGNCYPNKEKAQFEANREKYTRLFRQYVEQHSEPLDWSKANNQIKWYIVYDCDIKGLYYGNTYGHKQMCVYGSSQEVMQEAVEFIGEENVIKYVLGVESE